MARHVGALALVAAGVLVLVSDLRPSVSGDAGLIGGPYAYLLASSTDLGPSHRIDAQLTAALRNSMRPDALFGWADHNGLAVRWRPGAQWAVVEGAAENVAKAFDVEVHDYRGQRGQVFYASPQQPSIPGSLRDEVAEFGRILGYTPHHMSRPSILPLDVPDKGLTPGGLLTTYNVNRLAADGYTGKGTTIVFFA
ncbi:MAG: kumamolisin, partial [Mycobacterium sp.]|nr:kumamolisin [Mycobacterium sp.]